MNNGMYQGYSVEGSAELKLTPDKTMSYEDQTYSCNTMNGIVCAPIYECPQERCIHKQIIHEVPHVCPVNTRIINHHIYKHTYSPCYTCTEENEVCNVTEYNPCKFM